MSENIYVIALKWVIFGLPGLQAAKKEDCSPRKILGSYQFSRQQIEVTNEEWEQVKKGS